MAFEPAPFHAGIAGAPDGAHAIWADTDDGVRVRLAVLGPPGQAGCRGTVLLFPGRTEYVEKYGPAAADLRARGFACASIDWRGQGLADRPLDDPSTGHVASFDEYQRDVATLTSAAETLDLPRPFFLLAHSMGGAIGLRALHEGLPVAAACFSGPMWGIAFPPGLGQAVQLLAALGHSTGFGHTFVPTTKPKAYVQDSPFEGNTLTRDPKMYGWLRDHMTAHPELALGGPSMTWLHQAMRELRSLHALPPPEFPCLTWVGANERIVDMGAIRRVMGRWPGGNLQIVQQAEHELMLEVPATRDAFYDAAADHFTASALAAQPEARKTSQA